jgi:hypothetical protein
MYLCDVSKNERREHMVTVAYTLRHRLRAQAWFSAMTARHPGGIVTVGKAAKMLNVSPQHVRRLIADGKLPSFPAPSEIGGTWIPVAALLGAPTPLERGRPRLRTTGNPLGSRAMSRPNLYPATPHYPQSGVEPEKNISEDDEA